MGWLANLHLRLSKQALGLARVSNPPRCIRMSQGTSFPVNNDDDDDDHNDNGNNYGAKGQRDNGRRYVDTSIRRSSRPIHRKMRMDHHDLAWLGLTISGVGNNLVNQYVSRQGRAQRSVRSAQCSVLSCRSPFVFLWLPAPVTPSRSRCMRMPRC
jgi:hypothetical protein